LTKIGASNGLLRQYFPKGTDLSVHTAGNLHEVAAELNTRPRQVLQWATPHATFSTLHNVPVLRPSSESAPSSGGQFQGSGTVSVIFGGSVGE